MHNNLKWSLTAEEKDRMISALTAELTTLRTKAGISQEELSELIGVSRQTYGALERGVRRMSWTTFLSLVLFYDCNKRTHLMLRSIEAIPQVMMKKFNGGSDVMDVNMDVFLGDGTDTILKNLDEQAIRSIRTMIMVEYARCTSTPGEVVVKSFDGINFVTRKTVENVEATKALRSIRERKSGHGKS